MEVLQKKTTLGYRPHSTGHERQRSGVAISSQSHRQTMYPSSAKTASHKKGTPQFWLTAVNSYSAPHKVTDYKRKYDKVTITIHLLTLKCSPAKYQSINTPLQ